MSENLPVKWKDSIKAKLKAFVSKIFNNHPKEHETLSVPDASEERRIVICGEPHSGKSVLYRTLYKALPQQYMVNISACPDAESIFSGNIDQEMIQLSRIKGKYSPQFVKDAKQAIDNIDTSILFCDIGGKISKENKEICSRCNTAIILYKSPEILEEWKKFCKETGLEIIAEVESKQDITKDNSEILSKAGDSVIRGKIYNLERGSEQRKVNDKLIKNICDEICRPLLEKGNLKKTGSQILKDKSTLNMGMVANHLHLIDENNNIVWKASDAGRISDVVRGFAYSKNKVVLYDARATWLSALAVDSTAKEGVEDIALYDARLGEAIKTKKLLTTDSLEKTTMPDFDRYELVKGKLFLYMKQSDSECVMNFMTNPPDFRIPLEYLNHMKLPNIDESKELYMMGRIPLWLLNSVSRSYANTEKYCCQMGRGKELYTKFASADRGNLGMTKENMDSIDTKDFLKSVTEDMKSIIDRDSKRNIGEYR